MHAYVLVSDVADLTVTLITRICLHVYRLDGPLKVDLFEGDSSHASIVDARRDGANAHADAEHNVAVAHCDVL